MKPFNLLCAVFVIAALITPIRAPLPALAIPLAMFGAGTLLPSMFKNLGFGGRSEPQVIQVRSSPRSDYGSYGNFAPGGGGGGGMGMGGGGLGGQFGQPIMVGGGGFGGQDFGFGGGMQGGGGGFGGQMGGGFGGNMGGGGSFSGMGGGGFGGGNFDMFGKRKRRSIRRFRSASNIEKPLV